MAESTAGWDTPPRKVRRSGEAAEREEKNGVRGINIDHLPDEIMINIFSSVSFNDLVDSVQNVCTRWKRLAHDPVLWLDKEYIIKGRNSTQKGRRCCGVVWSKCIHCRCEGKDEQILRTAAMTPQLRKLTLMRSVTASVLENIFTNWPNLTVLEIDGSQKMEESLMKDIFEKCPKIQKLKLEATLLAGRRCGELSSLDHLRSLEVFKDKFCLNNVSMRVVANTCPRLQEIGFQWGGDKDDMAYFLKAKQHSITSIKVFWALGRISTKCVVPMLKQCHALIKLQLEYYELPPWLDTEAFEALGELHSLRELSIKSARPYRPEVMSLAFRPGCLTQLRRLRLVTFQLQNETVIAISRACPNLRELRLQFAGQITDTALSYIHHLKHLKILELCGCRLLGGTSLTHIAELPALNTLVLKSFYDLSELQPGLLDILKMKELRSLEILKCSNIRSVPFYLFPGSLVKLRELRVTPCDDEEESFRKHVLAKLQHRMPHLRVFNTHWLEEDDFPTGDESYDSESCDSGDADFSDDSEAGYYLLE